MNWGRTREMSPAQSKHEADRWSLMVWLSEHATVRKAEGEISSIWTEPWDVPVCTPPLLVNVQLASRWRWILRFPIYRESLGWKRYLKANNEVNQKKLMRDSSQGLLMTGGTNILVWKSNIGTEFLVIGLKQESDSKHWMGAERISEWLCMNYRVGKME